MIIKVETYFEIIVTGNEKISDDLKPNLSLLVQREISNEITIRAGMWHRDSIVAKKLNQEQVLEKIRIAK